MGISELEILSGAEMNVFAAILLALKGIALLVVGLFIGKAIWVATFFVSGRAIITNHDRRDSFARLAYLIHKTLREPLRVEDMPSYLRAQFKGEWALVSYSMTAAAIANLAFAYPESQEGAADLISRLIDVVLQPEILAFDKKRWGEDALADLDQPAGHIGYLGHLNFMLAAYHLVGGQQPERRHLFERVSLHLRRVIEASPFLCAETYPDEVYLADNAVAIASLALFEQVDATAGTGIGARWLSYAQDHLRDPATGLFVFRLSRSGWPMQGSRGSGSAWSLFYLSYFAAEEAVEQYWLLKQHFGKRIFPGVTGVCEWPGGQKHGGDIDSGPLIFGLSPAATGFAMAGARLAQDTPFLSALSLTAELAGFSVQFRGRRRYLVADRIAPVIGDAILLAMKTVTAWDGRYIESEGSTAMPAVSWLHSGR